MKQNENTNKLTEKAFSRLVVSSVLGIVVCLMCLCSVTWAWYNATASSNENSVESGSFGLDVTVSDENGASVAVVKADNGTSTCTLEAAGEYTVLLERSADTTVTKGFCAIKVKGTQNTYRTAAINSAEGINSLSFKVKTEAANVELSFAPAWGLPAETSVENTGTLVIPLPQYSEN